MRLRCLVHHLIHGQRQEIAKHDVDDRPQSSHGGANSNACEAGLGDRRIEDALSAEFFHESREHFERRSRLGNVFAENTHTRVAAHFLGQRLAYRLRKCEFTLWHR